MRKFWLYIIPFLIFASSCSNDEIIHKENKEEIAISNLSVMIDSTNKLSLQNILQDSLKFDKVEKLDIKRNKYSNWVAFDVFNPSKIARLDYILVDYISIENIECFEKGQTGKLIKTAVSGWQFPINKRPIRTYLIAFPLSLKAYQHKKIYFKILSKYFSIKTDLSVIDQNTLFKLDNSGLFTNLLMGISVLAGLLFCIASVTFNRTTRKELFMYIGCMVLDLVFAFIKELPYFTDHLIPPIANYSSEATIICGNICYLYFVFYFSKPTVGIEKKVWASLLKFFVIFAIIVLNILAVSFWKYEWVETYMIAKMLFAFVTYPFIIIIILFRFKTTIFARILFCSTFPILAYILVYMCTQQFGLLNIDKRTMSDIGRFTVVLDVYMLIFGIVYKQRKERLSLWKDNQEKQEKLLTTQIETQEAERQRLAQDLHDDLGGTLSAIKGRIATESLNLDTINLVEKAIEDLRLVSRNLLPPELANDGLQKAIQYTIERLQKAYKIQFTYVTFGNEIRLSEEKELNIYRIVSELLNNIIKHSKASKAVIQLVFYEEYLHISIEDNGIGIKTEQNTWGIGLKNIHSRVDFLKAKILTDWSDKGTTFIIEVPYK